jgi:hypothetical protein
MGLNEGVNISPRGQNQPLGAGLRIATSNATNLIALKLTMAGVLTKY